MHDGCDADDGQGLRRREAVRTTLVGLGGLAAAQVLPGAVGEAEAAPASPGAGPQVTPNPIKVPIEKSGLAVELVDFCAPPRTSSAPPYALINTCYHAGLGSGRLFANDTRGKLYQIDRRTGEATVVLDVLGARGGFSRANPSRGGALIKHTRTTGLRSFAFHPDYARRGEPGYGKLYTATTETPASRPGGVRVFAGDHPVEIDCVVAEWSADATNLWRINPNSRRELFRITMYGSDHNIDQLIFDPNLGPGDEGYGLMFMGVGDGGSRAIADPYKQAQNPKRLAGKVLCIDPLRQGDGRAYKVPNTNPFFGDRAYWGEIWALGFRHPENLCFDAGGDGTFFISDIGDSMIEEVNIGVRGGNYGWPLREGTFVTDQSTSLTLYALGTADRGRNFTYPVAQYDHSEGKAITVGYVYRGTRVPDLVGHLLFGDIRNGRVFHVPAAELRLGRQATIKELTLLRGGRPVTMLALVGASNPPGRVDLRFGQDDDGEMYVVSKQDGMIRRIAAA
jgi:Glucose / Sorbosone dehydrogenase